MNEYSKYLDYTDVVITTADLHIDYEIVSPVFFQTNNAGPVFNELLISYTDEITKWESQGQGSYDRYHFAEILGDIFNFLDGFRDRDIMGNAHVMYDVAFFICIQELKKRALALGCDAIIGMKYDLDLDTNGFQRFYMQMYGTAVRTKQFVDNNNLYAEKRAERELLELENNRVREMNRKQKKEEFINKYDLNDVLSKEGVVAFFAKATKEEELSELFNSWEIYKEYIPIELQNTVYTKLFDLVQYEKKYGPDVAEKEIEKFIFSIENII